MRALMLSLVLCPSCRGGTSAPSTVPSPRSAAARVVVEIGPGLAEGPLDGRLLVIVATRATPEPRFQLGDDDDTAQLFGVDVDGWDGLAPQRVDGDVAGYPLPSLAALPPGEYTVQALFNRYETYHRADGHVVKLPPDRGEGQQWNLKPGNLFSTPCQLHIAPGETTTVTLDSVIPPIPDPPDSPFIRNLRIRSAKLSAFWGRDVEIGAVVLLPHGWDDHPTARYPVLIYHSHFGRTLSGWRETPPDPELPAVDLDGLRRECPNGHGDACARHGYERYMQEASHRFFQQWTGPGFPRVILVQINHANPYYDDSYAVNSANLGPYGDAITHELLPAIETRFRGIGAGWARGMYGGSTGGWEALAAQIFYPDEYNGAVANCPDPIDFRAYMAVNLYEHDNAFVSRGPFRETPRPTSRHPNATTRSTMAHDNAFELALGTRSRSGQQFDIWEAVYSPVGADGYPQRIFDKRTGAIDKAVAAHWREHYDLGHIVTRDWATLGPRLAGKMWLNVGESDSYFLAEAVQLFEERLRALRDPEPAAVFRYGARDGHCWSGDAAHMNFESRMTYHARFIPMLVDHFLGTAPKGADVTSWRY